MEKGFVVLGSSGNLVNGSWCILAKLSFCSKSANQRIKLKGDKTVFYEKLDSLSRIKGSGWQKDEEGYLFNSWSVKDNTDFVNYVSIDVNVEENKAYIHFGNI